MCEPIPNTAANRHERLGNVPLTIYPHLPTPINVSVLFHPSAPTLDEIERSKGTLLANSNRKLLEYTSIPNWRELLSILPGLMLVFIGGTQFSVIIHTIMDHERPSIWTNDSTFGFDIVRPVLPLHVFTQIISWFTGIGLGSLLVSIFIANKPKWILYVSHRLSRPFLASRSLCACQIIEYNYNNISFQNFASVTVILAGYNLIHQPSTSTVLNGRFLSGFALGMGYHTVFVHAADITTHQVRNFAVKMISFIAAASLVVFELANVTSDSKLGKLLMTLGACNIVFVLFTKESIPFLLTHKCDEKALLLLTEYRGERLPSSETQQILAELKLKTLGAQSKLNGARFFGPSNLHALINVGAMRMLSLLSSNIPIMLIIYSSIEPYFNGWPKNQIFAVFLGLRLTEGWLFWLVSRCATNPYYLFYKLAIVNGIALLLILSPLRTNLTYLKEFAALYLMTHNLMAFGIDALKNEQMSNRFMHGNRPWSIAIGDIVEQFAHILLFVLCYMHLHNIVIFICGLGFVLIAILLRIDQMNAMRKQIVDEITMPA